MRRIVGLFFLAILAAGPLTAGQVKIKDLPSQYKNWLEEEVVYIINPMEKEVFLQLQTDRERNLFIEAFWKQRDPSPASPENEFKTEHLRRLNHANRYYGRTAAKAGWRTDRGRVYIILGEPNTTERYETSSTNYASEVWFYQGREADGLPAGFNLLFFQENGIGDFILYSPTRDGPQALMPTYSGDPVDYLAAYEQLREAQPQLAEYSLSLIPGDSIAMMGRPSLASDLLIQKVETVPQTKFSARYAQKFLEYKDRVEVEYSTNYIDSDALVKVIRDESGESFVHFTMEPQRLSVEQYENKFYTSLKLNGSVTDKSNRIIFQFERNYSLDVDGEKIAALNRQPMSIQDMFPLIPGEYKLSILLKNEVSKEFASVEKNVVVPAEEPGPRLGSLILGYKASPVEGQANKLKPFLLGGIQVYAQAKPVFVMKGNLDVAFRASGLGPEAAPLAEVRYVISKDQAEFRTLTRKAGEYSGWPNVVEEFSLAEFLPARYGLRVSLWVAGKEASWQTEEFDITHQESISRPWVYSKVPSERGSSVYDYIIGTELFNSGRPEEARTKLEKAYEKTPDSVDFAYSLANAYLALGEFGKVEPVLLPFFKRKETARYDFFVLLGSAYQKLGEWAKAIDILDKAVSSYGINTSLLNPLGECYTRLGKTAEALTVLEKSLELNPNQPEIKKAVEALKVKK